MAAYLITPFLVIPSRHSCSPSVEVDSHVWCQIVELVRTDERYEPGGTCLLVNHAFKKWLPDLRFFASMPQSADTVAWQGQGLPYSYSLLLGAILLKSQVATSIGADCINLVVQACVMTVRVSRFAQTELRFCPSTR